MGAPRVAVVQFPGSNCDYDTVHALGTVMGFPTRLVWHQETDLGDAELVILPGGFSYGDYLRTGAIARVSPIMNAVIRHAERGGLVLGICNGFQVLCEAGLLPGALLRNAGTHFISDWVHLRVERTDTPFTRAAQHGQVLRIPIAHGDGCYFADEATLDALEANGQVVFRYCDAGGMVTLESNPNGAARNIAGICNAAGNVVALMPHPERASETLLGSADGRVLWESLLAGVARDGRMPAAAGRR